ncbi:hypothetical protein FKW77_005573 [Venturia effusa]|uniref:NADAR domain-containing protein n=1 Tax=Venturia effusa TaxID=50376 RepID=A0A517KWE8_9PEZI|nr:hypothetical protein FKW77_005573 [Venturia effusa]
MKTILLKTGQKMICEAARRDLIWGIGMDGAAAIATWNVLGADAVESWGLNLLGKASVAVREKGGTGEMKMGEEKEELVEGEMEEGKGKSEREKRIRSLGKRLRDIEDLKERDRGERRYSRIRF